jgi:uncharacterized low-complexity protein
MRSVYCVPGLKNILKGSKMKKMGLLALLFSAALFMSLGVTSAMADDSGSSKCSAEKKAMGASKCSAEKKDMNASKCSAEKKAMKSGKCGGAGKCDK